MEKVDTHLDQIPVCPECKHYRLGNVVLGPVTCMCRCKTEPVMDGGKIRFCPHCHAQLKRHYKECPGCHKKEYCVVEVCRQFRSKIYANQNPLVREYKMQYWRDRYKSKHNPEQPKFIQPEGEVQLPTLQ